MQFSLEQARKYAGMTQKEVADGLHIDRSTYIKIEKDINRATIGQITQFCKLTGIPVSNLILPINSTNVE